MTHLPHTETLLLEKLKIPTPIVFQAENAKLLSNAATHSMLRLQGSYHLKELDQMNWVLFAI
jgi:hypothetical protein